MKRIFPKRVGGRLSINYQIKRIVSTKYISYSVMNSEDSPYGSFSSYTSALPYDRYKDENGVVPKICLNGIIDPG